LVPPVPLVNLNARVAAGDGDDLMAEAGAVGAAGAREGEGAGAATVGGAEDARELLRRTTATTDRLPAIR
jgi:hypothetical protein